MHAFITGSHAYGEPTDRSDIDLVVRCSEEEAQLLLQQCEQPLAKPPQLANLSPDWELDPTMSSPTAYHNIRSHTARFGKLNLLICTTDHQYAQWCLGTSVLKKRATDCDKRPDREEAVELFTEIREYY